MVAAPTVTVAGLELDPATIGTPLELVFGRADYTVQPDPPTAVFLVYGTPPPAVTIGAPVQIVAQIPTGAPSDAGWLDPDYSWTDDRTSWLGSPTLRLTRFTGTVAAIDVARDVGQPDTYRVSALGQSATLARRKITLTRPAETDLERVAAIAAAAGMPVTIRGTTATELEPDNLERSALSALHELCASTGALVWEEPDGTIVYGTADHRADQRTTVSLSPSEVFAGVTWHRNTTAIVNHVTVEYGPEDTRVQDTYDRPASITAWGLQHADAVTLCAGPEDAGALALAILDRRADPVWAVDVVETDTTVLSPPNYRELARAQLGGPIAVPVPDSPDQLEPTPTVWTLEGYAEVFEHSTTTGRLEHTFGMALVDRDVWGAPTLRTYGELPAYTYADAATVSYLAVLISEIP